MLSTVIFGLLIVVAVENTSAQELYRIEQRQYSLAVYVWGASIGGTTNGGNNIDIPFSDIIDRLDLGLMTALSTRKGRWSSTVDLIYLNVSDDLSVTVDPGTGPVPAALDIKLRGFISTINIGYTVTETRGFRLTLFGGGRYLWLKPELDVVADDSASTRVLLGASGHLWDGVVGFKGTVNLSQKWHLPYYLDIGTGENDFSLQALIGISRRFQTFSLSGGYRYLKWNFDDDDPGGKVFDLLDFSGPYLGVAFPLGS
jgi:hypothetical protein